MLRIKNLHTCYGRIKALENVSLHVRIGEIVSLIGANGAGKTTTIRLLLSLIYPTSGKADIFGLDTIQDHIEITRRIGYIPSGIKPQGNLTGSSFLEYMARFYKKDTLMRQELLDLFEMSDRDLKRKIRDYSTGMARKLAIIQAFEHEPELIIMDDPTEGLDPVMQHRFYELLRDFKKKEGTVFISSHHLREVERICDRAAIIRKGHLVAVEEVSLLLSGASRSIKIKFGTIIARNKINRNLIRISEFDGKHLKGTVTGSIDSLVKSLSQFKIDDITLPPISLEDVFLKYYQDEEND